MVQKEDLVFAHDEAEIPKLLDENTDFDVIPVEQNGELSSYFVRGSKGPKPIHLQEIISDGTSVLDMIDILQDRQFCFVLVNHRIMGYVHFSDLNNHIVKLPLYVIFEAFERRLVREVGSIIGKDNLETVLNPQRSEHVKRIMSKMRENRANLEWVSLLSFSEIVRFACHFERVNLGQEQLYSMFKVRNLVSHATDPLVEQHEDVRRLSEAKTICMSVLKELTLLPVKDI